MRRRQISGLCKDNGGFTLLELIITMAIIAILAGLFANMYMNYVEKARIAKQEDMAKKIYDAAEISVVELALNEDGLGLNYANISAQYHDPVTGKACGVIATDILGPVAAGSMSPASSEKAQIAAYIIEIAGADVDFSNANPAGSQCNFSDGQVRAIIVLDDEGVLRVEYGRDKYLTTVINGEVTTKKWMSDNAVNFSNPR